MDCAIPDRRMVLPCVPPRNAMSASATTMAPPVLAPASRIHSSPHPGAHTSPAMATTMATLTTRQAGRCSARRPISVVMARPATMPASWKPNRCQPAVVGATPREASTVGSQFMRVK